MAQDIMPMDAWDTECPCCGCKLAVEWQLSVYADGGDPPQFVGLRKVGEIPLNKIQQAVKKAPPKRVTAESLRKKTYHPQRESKPRN